MQNGRDYQQYHHQSQFAYNLHSLQFVKGQGDRLSLISVSRHNNN
jgi:hypothetical protein